MKTLNRKAALLVVDMQEGFGDPEWGARNNPRLEDNVAALLAAWRQARQTVIHVHHDSPHVEGRLRRGTPGNDPIPRTRPIDKEKLYRKSVNSAFIGTSLEFDLRQSGIDTLVIVGLTTNHCISTTARMSGNLGFDTYVVSDATATFDRRGLDGRMRRAEDVHMAALSDLNEEFAQIIDTAEVLAALSHEDESAPRGSHAHA
ncbi:MAG TPA: cysteine hydrolase family protein [Rhizomicrobium sp.]|nr:cysteine hydrolase family protein [Rhizomicrobium sp.]